MNSAVTNGQQRAVGPLSTGKRGWPVLRRPISIRGGSLVVTVAASDGAGVRFLRGQYVEVATSNSTDSTASQTATTHWPYLTASVDFTDDSKVDGSR